MHNKAEFVFLNSILDKCNIPSRVIDIDIGPEDDLDLGLRKMLGREYGYSRTMYESTVSGLENAVYRYTDRYMCSYILMHLPKTEGKKLFSIGPFLSLTLSEEEMYELAEKLKIPPSKITALQDYYRRLYSVTDDGAVMAAIHTYAEMIWGSNKSYKLIDLNREISESVSPLDTTEDTQADETLWRMQELETRYAYENELLDSISQGLQQKAETLLRSLSPMALEQRVADPVRNLKNYCIIMNTLLRKAAERGGVHPIYLDNISSQFAKKIEQFSSVKAAEKMMDDMFRSYCRLVTKHSTQKYSRPVQRAIVYIESDLAGDLSLKEIAGYLNINASYLSSLFKKETGQTMTSFINNKRIEYAVRLLVNTNLQIQTVAQHCGFSDINYFSKMFKKYTHFTPKEYRALSNR